MPEWLEVLLVAAGALLLTMLTAVAYAVIIAIVVGVPLAATVAIVIWTLRLLGVWAR
jgi:hypothetical protein